jgi:hypothetical protein
MEFNFHILTFNDDVIKQSGRRNKKKRNKLIQLMEVEIRKKGNCISQYNSLAAKEYINVINNPCKSKRRLRSFVESRVCHLMCIGVSFEQKHAL